MKKDIEKYINDNINAEVPKSLSKENIVSQLDRTPTILENKSKKKSGKILKFVSLAAAFAIVIGGVAIWKDSQRKVPVNPTKQNEAENSYGEIYAQMDELHKEYIKKRKENIINGVFNTVTFNSKNEASDEMLSGSAQEGLGASFGTTNTQEKGIDEGDIIKTDGKNIYLVDSDNKSIYITSVSEMKQISKIKLDKENTNIQEIYLQDNKLIVVYSIYDYNIEKNIRFGAHDTCCMAWFCSDTYINIYDVKNPTSPNLLSCNKQQGNYVSSRIINGKLYTVTSYGVDVASDDYKEKCIPETSENGIAQKIAAKDITIVNKNKNNVSYAVVTATDVCSAKITNSSAIFGDPTILYASKNSIYIAENCYDAENAISYLNISKFKITENGIEYIASARVEGMVKDNLSMSEQGDFFRIATTREICKISGNGKEKTVSYLGDTNSLYVFDKDMNKVGYIDSFGKDEQIRSVRFIGSFAYVVTFRQTDPLFVIDLTDSTNPKIVGELTLPGFSSYLHPFGDGFLIGVGQDGTEAGINGNMKVSLFSVADPESPTEASTIKVNEEGMHADSNLSYNYKAFVNLPNNEFCIPFMLYGTTYQSYQRAFIRYRIENGEIKEVARYVVGGYQSNIIGGTYVGGYFYAFSSDFTDDYNTYYNTKLTKFDMATNEKVNEITFS